MTHANIQNRQQKYGKLPAKLADETLWNKLYVDIIGPYKIRIKKKKPLILKVFTMIYPVTGWFEISQYSNKKSVTIADLM